MRYGTSHNAYRLHVDEELENRLREYFSANPGKTPAQNIRALLRQALSIFEYRQMKRGKDKTE